MCWGIDFLKNTTTFVLSNNKNHRKMKNKTINPSSEKGSAEINITFKNGTITVKHFDGTVLKTIENAEIGSWDKLFSTINNLKSVNEPKTLH